MDAYPSGDGSCQKDPDDIGRSAVRRIRERKIAGRDHRGGVTMKNKPSQETPGPSLKPVAAPTDEAAFGEITRLIRASRQRVHQGVNAELIMLYWQVGEYINRNPHSPDWQGVAGPPGGRGTRLLPHRGLPSHPLGFGWEAGGLLGRALMGRGITNHCHLDKRHSLWNPEGIRAGNPELWTGTRGFMEKRIGGNT